MKRTIKVIFTGGGSGGHTIPAVSMIDTLKSYCKNNRIKCQIIYIGSKLGIEKKIIQKKGITYFSITTGKLRRYFSLQNIVDIFKVIYGIVESFLLIKKIKPDLVFSTGGFVSVPPIIAAKLNKTPSIIHEQTIDAGLANKLASKFANKVALTFENSRKYFPASKISITGIPLRDEIFGGNREESLQRLKLDLSKKVIYFSGGGLGCHMLNKTAIDILPNLLKNNNVIFQTGNTNNGKDYIELLKFKKTLPEESKNRLLVYNFITDDLKDILTVTDIAVARSGAGTVNEFIALKIPAIFIPLAIATNNEQLKNAQVMSEIGGAEIIEEKELSGNLLSVTINNIINTEQIKIMKSNLKKIKNFRGNDKLLNLIIETITLD